MSKQKKSAYGGLIIWAILVYSCVQSFADLMWANAFRLLVPIFGIPLWWVVFFTRVYCGVRTDNTPYCKNTAHGLLLGCPQQHKWSKVLARFNYFGIDWLHRQAKVTLGSPPAGMPLGRADRQFRPETKSGTEPHSTRGELAALYVAIASLAFTIVQTIVAIIAL